MSVLPASVRLSLWATAALAGALPMEQVMARAVPDADHVTGDVGRLQLWRDLGEQAVLVALPRPGDLTGMPRGSADFVGAATAAGECVYVPGVGGALVPTIERFGPPGDQGTQVTWTAYDTEPVPVHTLEALSLNEIELRLRQDLMARTQEIDALDAKPWEGRSLRSFADERLGAKAWGLPDGLPRRVRSIVSMSGTVSLVTDIGLVNTGGAVASHTAERRRVLLTDLQWAADRALAAAATIGALQLAGLRNGRSDT